jgi:MFS family permease
VALVCIGISGINSGVAVALSPALPSIAQELGGGNDARFVAQMIQTLPALAIVVGAAAAGYAAERWGRRLVTFAAVMLFTLAGLAGLAMPDLGTLVASRVAHGLAAGVMITTSYALVGEYFQGLARNRMLGFCAASGSFTTILMLAAGGPMVDHLGWRSVFLLFLPAAFLLPFILGSMRPGLPPRNDAVPLSWKPIAALWPLGLLQVAYTIGMFMSVIQVPFIATAKGIASASTISLLVATTSAAATSAALVHGWLRRFLDFRGMFVLMSAAFGGGLLICAGAQHLAGLLLGAAALGIGAGSLEPTLVARALNETAAALHDRAAGAAMATLFLGQFLNPVVVGPVAAIGGVSFAAAAFGTAYLAAGAIFIMSIGRRSWKMQRQ